MNRIKLYPVFFIVFVLLFLFGYYVLQNNNKNTNKENTGVRGEDIETVSVGIQTSPAMALVMIAEDKGFDLKNNIDINIKEFTAGKFALQAFLGGSLDIAISGDVPVTLATMQGNEFLVVGQVVRKTINETRIVARKDEFSQDPLTYFKSKKRKLSTSFGGGPEFFTYEFLKYLGIKDDEVELISQKPEDMPASLLSGSVDAISIFDPQAYIAERNMGDKHVTYTNPNVYSELYVINITTEMKNNKDKIKRFLKALIDAEKFAQQNPDEAKQIVMKYTKLDKDIVDNIWPNFDFRVFLTNELLEFWKREAFWAKEKNKVDPATPIPDFKNNVLFPDPLREIDPKRVEIVYE